MCAKMLRSKVFLWICVISGITCDVAPYLFPSYDNILGNASEIFCPDFDRIKDGNVVVQKLSQTRKVATITCDRGYDIEGSSNIYCIDGQWEYTSLPQCIKRCLSPPYLKEGALEIEGEKDEGGYYPKGTVASYSCSEGYELIPETSALRVCEKGIWTGAIATCVPNFSEVAGCTTPNTIENGYFVQEKSGGFEGYNSFGQRLHYTCNNGYSLIGPRVKQCLDDGSWSPKLQPICLLNDDNPGDIPCSSVPTVSNSAIEVIQQSDRRSMAGAIVEIRCPGKYRNSLSPCQTTKLKCHGGKWVGVLPRCVPARECFPPPLVPHATIIDVNYNLYDTNNPTNFPVKSTVTYQCLEGFIMEGEPMMSCSLGGCWTPSDPPVCVRERAPTARQPDENFIAEVDNINAILMSAAAGAGVLGILLLICLMVACKRKKQHSTAVAIPQPRPRQELEDHAALLEHPDRLALIACADGVQRNQLNLLPSYDEAIRCERGVCLAASRPHRPHWPNLGGRRTRNSPNPDVGHVTRHGSFASHTPSTRSAGDSMGSTDTMAVSEGSTNVTLDTASSHSGSQPASCRAHCGSLASFDACSVVNTEDVPLLEESEVEEIQGGTNDMENPAISENSSLKISTNSGDILSV